MDAQFALHDGVDIRDADDMHMEFVIRMQNENWERSLDDSNLVTNLCCTPDSSIPIPGEEQLAIGTLLGQLPDCRGCTRQKLCGMHKPEADYASDCKWQKVHLEMVCDPRAGILLRGRRRETCILSVCRPAVFS